MYRSVFICLMSIWISLPAGAQVSPVRLKVSKHQKSDSKNLYQSSDGYYRSAEKNKTLYYTVDLTNVSGGAAKDFNVKWAVLVRSDRIGYTMIDGEYRQSNPMRVVNGEKTCTLEFGKTCSFDTDVIEAAGWESVEGGNRRSEYGAKVVGYCVEVFVNDQRVASDIQPPDTKTKIEQASGTSDQKLHKFR
jgi:hypothetical protein